MTEIAMRTDQGAVETYSSNDTAMDRLGRWLQQADAVFAIAQKVCSTSFAPAAYRGKPDEAAAAMLAGAELGFDPMASLRAFDNIQGVPAPKALTLRAVVLGQGHEVEIVESTAQRAVVRGRRKGASEWQTSVWDIARAQLMPQYKSNPNYKTNPAAMLVARATSEVCRWVAPDAVMGMPYSAEEIGDHPQLAPSPIARRLTVADLDAAQPTSDEDRRAVIHRIEAAPTEPADDGQPVTDQQRKRMFALWGELGFTGDENRQNRLDITTKILGLTEPLESSNDLTRDEADRVIAALVERKERKQGGAE
jgi:hypothetical protein